MSLRHQVAARLRLTVPADGPGAAVLILGAGEVLYQGERGLADIAGGVPVTAQTAFDLASVSKQFTAVAVLRLVEQGRLTLETPLAEILPVWHSYPSGRPLRVLDLLGHTSGLPDYSRVWRGARVGARMTNARFLTRVLDRPPLFPAGSRADYSNTNYILLAAVLEALTQRPFAEHVAETLLVPLGMTGSAVIENPIYPIARRACGYKRVGNSVQASDIPIRLVGHSHLFSTTADLARWYRALWSGQVIEPDTVRRALTSGSLDDGTPHIYGLGWFNESQPGRPSMGHSGSWYGYSTYVRYYSTEQVTLVALSNNETFGNKAFIDHLADIVLKEPE